MKEEPTGQQPDTLISPGGGEMFKGQQPEGISPLLAMQITELEGGIEFLKNVQSMARQLSKAQERIKELEEEIDRLLNYPRT